MVKRGHDGKVITLTNYDIVKILAFYTYKEFWELGKVLTLPK